MGIREERKQAKRNIIDATPGVLDGLKARARARIVRTHRLGCWEAPGSTNSGYPTLTLPRRLSGSYVQVNHLVWRLQHGRWPAPGLLLLHKCDNKLCVRPDHHYEGDERDNALDHQGRPWADRCHGESC